MGQKLGYWIGVHVKQVLLVLLVVVAGLVLVQAFKGKSPSSPGTSTVVRYNSEQLASRTRVPTRPPEFQEIVNTCGACGTSSPVGGWETADGRWLILSADKTFSAKPDSGPSISGTWRITNGELCLTESIAGARQCMSYQQKTDAMKLNNAIYERY